MSFACITPFETAAAAVRLSHNVHIASAGGEVTHPCYRCAESLPEADFVVGFQRYEGLPATLRSALGGGLLAAEPKQQPVLPPHRVQVEPLLQLLQP